MKKNLLFTLIFLMTGVTSFGAENGANDYKAGKAVERTFATSDAPVLNVINRYGNVDISVWNENAIQVKAQIKVTCSNTKKVSAILDCIEVEMTQTGSIVTVRTNIDSKSIEAIKGRNENYNYQIDISIKAPRATTLNVENKYGNTNIEATSRKLSATIKYGHLTVGEIGMPSSVEIKYGNVKIEKASDIDLSIKYGNTNIGQMGNLRLIESGYGTHKYSSVGSVTGFVKYDNYSFGVVNGNLDFGECRYTNVSIDVLNGSLGIDELAYGDLKVYRLTPSFERVNVGARYSNVAIRVDAKMTFKLSLRNYYGSIATNLTGVTSELKMDESSSKALEMVVGSSPTKSIKVINRYGDIRVNEL